MRANCPNLKEVSVGFDPSPEAYDKFLISYGAQLLKAKPFYFYNYPDLCTEIALSCPNIPVDFEYLGSNLKSLHNLAPNITYLCASTCASSRRHISEGSTSSRVNGEALGFALSRCKRLDRLTLQSCFQRCCSNIKRIVRGSPNVSISELTLIYTSHESNSRIYQRSSHILLSFRYQPIRKLYLCIYNSKHLQLAVISQVSGMCKNLQQLYLIVGSVDDKKNCSKLVKQALNLTHFGISFSRHLVSSEGRLIVFLELVQDIFLCLLSACNLQEVSMLIRAYPECLDRVFILAKEFLRLDVHLRVNGEYKKWILGSILGKSTTRGRDSTPIQRNGIENAVDLS